MAENLVDRTGDLAAFDMGAADVVRRADQRAGQRLDPVAVDHDQIRFVLANEIGKTQYGFRQHKILRIIGALVYIVEDFNALNAVDLDLGQTVALHHMHAGNEEADAKTRIPRGNRQRFELAEVSTRSRHEY